MAQAIFTAYRMPLRVPITATLGRAADLARMSDAARETARAVSQVSPEKEIEVRYNKIADGSVDMVVTVPARSLHRR